MRILFVENDAVFADIVCGEFLAEHDVSIIGTIAAGVSLATVEHFDVILVDFDLDDGKGTELIAAVRSAGVRSRIIAVSAHERGNEALLAAGADAVCSKLDFATIRVHLVAGL